MSHVEEWRAEVLQILRSINRRTYFMHHELHHFAKKVVKMQSAIDELADGLAENTNATNAVSDLVTKLLADIAAAGGDVAEIRRVTAEYKANTAKLVAAALAGTPADPNAPPA